jgi:hypothetical protein
MEHLLKSTTTFGVLLEGLRGERLEDIEDLFAFGALVSVGRHNERRA